MKPHDWKRTSGIRSFSRLCSISAALAAKSHIRIAGVSPSCVANESLCATLATGSMGGSTISRCGQVVPGHPDQDLSSSQQVSLLCDSQEEQSFGHLRPHGSKYLGVVEWASCPPTLLVGEMATREWEVSAQEVFHLQVRRAGRLYSGACCSPTGHFPLSSDQPRGIRKRWVSLGTNSGLSLRGTPSVE